MSSCVLLICLKLKDCGVYNTVQSLGVWPPAYMPTPAILLVSPSWSCAVCSACTSWGEVHHPGVQETEVHRWLCDALVLLKVPCWGRREKRHLPWATAVWHEAKPESLFCINLSVHLHLIVSVCLSVCSKCHRPQGPVWPPKLHSSQGSGGQWLQIQPLLQGPRSEGWWGWELAWLCEL